jgi:hypothetical protein
LEIALVGNENQPLYCHANLRLALYKSEISARRTDAFASSEGISFFRFPGILPFFLSIKFKKTYWWFYSLEIALVGNEYQPLYFQTSLRFALYKSEITGRRLMPSLQAKASVIPISCILPIFPINQIQLQIYS